MLTMVIAAVFSTVGLIWLNNRPDDVSVVLTLIDPMPTVRLWGPPMLLF